MSEGIPNQSDGRRSLAEVLAGLNAGGAETSSAVTKGSVPGEAVPQFAPSYKEYVENPAYAEKIAELRPMVTAIRIANLEVVNPGSDKPVSKWEVMRGEFANELKDPDAYGYTQAQLDGYRLFHLLEGSTPDEGETPIVGFDLKNPDAEAGKAGLIEDYIRRMYAAAQAR